VGDQALPGQIPLDFSRPPPTAAELWAADIPAVRWLRSLHLATRDWWFQIGQGRSIFSFDDRSIIGTDQNENPRTLTAEGGAWVDGEGDVWAVLDGRGQPIHWQRRARR
jgi:hypothetical protein